MPALPYRLADRYGVDLGSADRETSRAVVGVLMGAGFLAMAALGGLGVLVSSASHGDLRWIWWLATPGWVLVLSGAFVSGDLSLHRSATRMPDASVRLFDHWVAGALVFAVIWIGLGLVLVPWIVANP